MAVAISRVQFLRGDLGGDRAPVRPPWALPEAVFTALCSRCGECTASCPERLLYPGRGGFPQVDFTQGGCSFCGACVEACRDRALLRGPSAKPWSVKAMFGARCLARNGVVCTTCADQCDAGAISLRPRRGSVAQPELDPGQCTGCGACCAPCPVNAIAMRYLSQEPAP